MLDRAGIGGGRRRFVRSVDARYQRQSYELQVPVSEGRLDAAQMPAIAAAFHERHRQTYGHDNRSEPVQLVNLRVEAIGTIPPLRICQETASAGSDAQKRRRRMLRPGGRARPDAHRQGPVDGHVTPQAARQDYGAADPDALLAAAKAKAQA